MNINNLKTLTKSKYFKPILKVIILLWFFYAVYDLFFKNSSDYSSTTEYNISSNNSDENLNSNSDIKNSTTDKDKSNTININNSNDNNYILYSYTISKGENLKTIAILFKTTKDKLKKINSLKNDEIKVGSSIKVPIKSIHVVKKGETLYSIAVKYGTTRKILIETNKLSSETNIKVGQSICIPML